MLIKKKKVIVLSINNQELIKRKIADKDKIKLEYKQKLNLIKQHYGVEFDVEHFKNNKIENIKFINLNYKNGYDNICINYNPNNRKVSYIDYDFADTRLVKNMKHKKFADDLERKYKLNLMVAEINRANNEYIEKTNEIDKYYNEISNDLNDNSKQLEINKNDKNE